MTAAYQVIGPRQLEKHFGDVASMFLFRRNRGNRSYTRGTIDVDSDGDPILRSDRYGEKIKIEHGDVIKIRTRGRGENSIREYVYLDDSD